MGLDMYLSKKTYIGAEYDHNKIEGVINITQHGKPIEIDLKKVSYIIESVGYWRKANQIHNWFVQNVQKGEDDCGEYYVEWVKLQDLKRSCEEVLKDKTKAEEVLPCRSGFFFGGVEYDEWYFQDLETTINIINSLKEEGDYYYSSSW